MIEVILVSTGTYVNHVPIAMSALQQSFYYRHPTNSFTADIYCTY